MNLYYERHKKFEQKAAETFENILLCTPIPLLNTVVLVEVVFSMKYLAREEVIVEYFHQNLNPRVWMANLTIGKCVGNQNIFDFYWNEIQPLNHTRQIISAGTENEK